MHSKSVYTSTVWLCVCIFSVFVSQNKQYRSHKYVLIRVFVCVCVFRPKPNGIGRTVLYVFDALETKTKIRSIGMRV